MGHESFSLLGSLTRDWQNLAGEPLDLKQPRLMKASSRPGENLPILFFLFDAGAERPGYVLKVSRNPEYPDAILREYRNYSAIYARLDGSGLSVPRPIFCAPIGSHTVLCETYVPGTRCEDRFFSVRWGWVRRRAIERFLEQAMRWARDFHLRTRRECQPIDRARLEREFLHPLSVFAARPDLGQGLAERLAAFRKCLDGLIGMQWPVAAVHGDFDHGNILLDGDRISVVDWEDCEPSGNPFVDLAYLIFHLALVSDLSLDRRRRLDAFFHAGSWSHGLVRRLLREYASSQDLEPDLFFLALPRTVIEVLSRDYGPERDPRSIQLYSLEMIEFCLDLSFREIRGWVS